MYRIIFSRMSIKPYGSANQREVEYDEKEFNKFIEQKKREGFKLLISVQSKNIAILSKEPRDGFEEEVIEDVSETVNEPVETAVFEKEATENVSVETTKKEPGGEKHSKAVQALLDANPDINVETLRSVLGLKKTDKITVSHVRAFLTPFEYK